MTTLPPTNDQADAEATNNKNRCLGISLLITQAGSMVAYGITGKYFQETNGEESYTEMFGIMMLMLFTLVGFGMLLNAYKYGTWLGSMTAIIVVAIAIQFSPLLQKFWFSVLITGFGSNPNASQVGENIRDFWRHYQTTNIEVNYRTHQTTLLACISLLTAMTAFIGRLNLNQVLKLTSFFVVFWNLNYFLLIRICTIIGDFNSSATAPLYAPYFFDAFGSSYVYLFGSVFGLIYSLFIYKQKFPRIHPQNEHNRISLVLALIGTAFIFSTFVFATNKFVTYAGKGSAFARFAIIWALTGSVVGTYVGSALAGKGRVGFKEALVGVISGGVVMASAAPILDNIGIIIMCGVIVGLFSGIYMRTVHVAINKNFTRDTLGLFGPFLISSLFGSFVLVPSVLAYYHNNGILFPSIGVLVPVGLPGWQLAYVGITVGIAIGSGVLCGLMSLCDRENYGLGTNSRFFMNEFGLYDPDQDDFVEAYDDYKQESGKDLNQ